MFETTGPHVFALSPGEDFPTELVRGLKLRLVGSPPEAMAKVTLYVNTSRMRRRIVDLFCQTGAGFLPKIIVVSELSQHPELADLPRAVSPLRRRLELAKLVDAMLTAQPEIAPRASLYDLADSLANLMDEMHGEDVSIETVAGLDVSNHSGHWLRTQGFLKIIAPFVGDKTNPDPEARQRMAVERLLAIWQANPPRDPVLVVGSTGSRGTTALLMKGMAGLSQGGLILPGFDFAMPLDSWADLSDQLTCEDHPQFRYKRLMEALDISAGDVQRWTDASPPDEARNQLISLSLRPAPVTDQWLHEGPKLGDLRLSTAGMTLIEAQNPRTEATAIAVVLRKAAQDGVRAALVSPDRNLTRQVVAALDRWGIMPDDSAGKPLGLSAPGRLLRQIAGLFGKVLTAEQLLALLKHPLTASGADRGNHLRYTQNLDLKLRRYGPLFPTSAGIIAWAETQRDAACLPWAQNLAASMDQLSDGNARHLTEHAARHWKLAERLARGVGADGSGGLWENDAGKEALMQMQRLQTDAPFGDVMTCGEYRNLFDQVMSQGEVRETMLSHPNIMIWGTLEARVQGADLVILGGLNDGTWPSIPAPDPWLNRQMRKDAGLLLPERRVGLAAHDYQQAVAAPKVILTRSIRNAEAETVASRWVNRLINLISGLQDNHGPEALADMRARGQDWLQLAQAIDLPTAVQRADGSLRPALRPAPRPPLAARPKALSLSKISQLIRDPYAIYARYILGLQPLDPLSPGAGYRERGTAVHQILETFVKERPQDETQSAARQRLLAIAVEVFAEHTPLPSARAIWFARLQRAANHFLQSDAKMGGVAIGVETKGRIRLDPLDFELNGTPDRIDRLPDGKLHLIDYKTGPAPTEKAQEHFEKQLLLGAAMAERGGFEALGPSEVAAITYISLSSAQTNRATDLTSDLLDVEWAKFVKLITRYGQRETGYAARRAVFKSDDTSDYDHLSRFGEWEMTVNATSENVGDEDPV